MSQVFPQGSQSAYTRYVNALSDAIKNRDWVYDPSFALQSDRQIYEKILRDPVAAHAIRFRKHLVAAAEVRVVSASERPEDEAAAKICEDLLRKISGFTDARICLANAIFQGSSYARITGSRKNIIAGTLPGGDDPVPLNWWVPERLQDVDRRRFRLERDPKTKTMHWQLWSVERRDWEPLTHPEWFIRSVYEAVESSLGYGRGLLDTLYYFQSTKARSLQDLTSAGERFGQGLITIAIDNLRAADGRPVGGDLNSTSKIAADWQRELGKQRSRHVLVHDSRDELKTYNGIGEGWQLLQWILGYLDNAQVTAILGSTLPTLEGDGGSRALGEVQENSTEALVQADRARLADDLTRDLLGLIWRLNRDQIMAQVGPAQMPTLKIDQRKREDPKEAADLIAVLLGAGVKLRAREVYEKVGFTMPLPGDDVIEGGAASPLAGLGFAAPELEQPPEQAPPELPGPNANGDYGMPTLPSPFELMANLGRGVA